MTKDEILYFVQYDSDPLSPCRYCFHTAFSDPKVPASMPQRQSVEVRAIAFFHDYMRAPPKVVKNLSEEIFAERVGAHAGPAAHANAAMFAGNDEDAQMAQAFAASRMAAEEDEAMKASLAASLYGELGHVSRQASGNLLPAAAAAGPSRDAGPSRANAAYVGNGEDAQMAQALAASRMAAEEDEAMMAALAASLGNPLPVAAAAAAAPPPSTLPAHLVETVRTMAERGGMGAEAIAGMLKLDLEQVKAALPPPARPPADGKADAMDVS